MFKAHLGICMLLLSSCLCLAAEKEPGRTDLRLTLYVRDTELQAQHGTCVVIEVENRGSSAAKFQEPPAIDRIMDSDTKAGELDKRERVRDKSNVIFLAVRITVPAQTGTGINCRSGLLPVKFRSINAGESGFFKVEVPKEYLAQGACRLEAYAWPSDGPIVFSQACMVGVKNWQTRDEGRQ